MGIIPSETKVSKNFRTCKSVLIIFRKKKLIVMTIFPDIGQMYKIPWHFFKIPQQFPDLEKIFVFPWHVATLKKFHMCQISVSLPRWGWVIYFYFVKKNLISLICRVDLLFLIFINGLMNPSPRRDYLKCRGWSSRLLINIQWSVAQVSFKDIKCCLRKTIFTVYLQKR